MIQLYGGRLSHTSLLQLNILCELCSDYFVYEQKYYKIFKIGTDLFCYNTQFYTVKKQPLRPRNEELFFRRNKRWLYSNYFHLWPMFPPRRDGHFFQLTQL